jgi:hypothetical protein
MLETQLRDTPPSEPDCLNWNRRAFPGSQARLTCRVGLTRLELVGVVALGRHSSAADEARGYHLQHPNVTVFSR